ncbi:MAG: hypothetical protein HYY37_03765 [Candidatus Aenigmarchaeota archaeon]|nr:hypothetical protein [Candidatus Aenigmarchaeota archaeon]
MKQKIFTALFVVAFLLGPAHAQLGSQSFPSIDFTDDTLSDAELEAAETSFSNPGMLPDHPLYVFKQVKERFDLFLAFDKDAKAKLHLTFAQKRLSEARELVARNKTRVAEASLAAYKEELSQFSGAASSSLAAEGRMVLEKSAIVISSLIEKAPEQATPALQAVLNASLEEKEKIQRNKKARESEARIEIPKTTTTIAAPREKTPSTTLDKPATEEKPQQETGPAKEEPPAEKETKEGKKDKEDKPAPKSITIQTTLQPEQRVTVALPL